MAAAAALSVVVLAPLTVMLAGWVDGRKGPHPADVRQRVVVDVASVMEINGRTPR